MNSDRRGLSDRHPRRPCTQPRHPSPKRPPGTFRRPPSAPTGFAIASLIVVFFSSVIGVVLGYVALSQIKRTGESGRHLALSAVIIGWAASGLDIVVVIVYFVALSHVASSRY